jgi:hypothetical protein
MGTGMNLKTSYVFAFFPMSRIVSLPKEILNFERYKKESIGVAWDRFSVLIHSSLDLSLPDSLLQPLFCLGLDIEADLYLDVTTGCCFTHKTMTEQVKFFEHFLDTLPLS